MPRHSRDEDFGQGQDRHSRVGRVPHDTRDGAQELLGAQQPGVRRCGGEAHLVQPPSVPKDERRLQDRLQRGGRRLDRGHPHGAYRAQAERAAPEDLRDLGQWRLQQGVAYRCGLRHRIRPRIPARPQEHAHDHQRPRRLRVAPACSPHGRRARRGVRQVRP